MADAKNKTKKATTKKAEAIEAEVLTESTASSNTSTKKSYKVKTELDPNMMVTVKNAFNGTLIYISRKTGEQFVWEQFGDEQEMELGELKNARNSSKAFFENNWFSIDDQEVLEWLNVSKYYENALTADNFDDVFSKSPEELEELINELSNGQKRTLVYRSKQLIDDGVIDSIKTINTLEKCLGVELIER